MVQKIEFYVYNVLWAIVDVLRETQPKLEFNCSEVKCFQISKNKKGNT